MVLLLGEEKISEKEAALFNPLQLAYLGDAVWESLVRQTLAFRHLNVNHMHSECVRHVNAKAQAGFLNQLRTKLNETELYIVQRGRNAHARHPAPRNQSPADYAEATGFEALIGYLYLTDQDERLRHIVRTVLEKEAEATGNNTGSSR